MTNIPIIIVEKQQYKKQEASSERKKERRDERMGLKTERRTSDVMRWVGEARLTWKATLRKRQKGILRSESINSSKI